MKRTLVLSLGLLVAAGCDSSDPDPVAVDVRVMTQNLYLGGDLFVVADPTLPAEQVPVRVAQLYGTIEASDPAARMAAIAAEIAEVDPDLVGLQEVSTFYVQSPADNLPGGAATTATAVTFDFLDLLMTALADAGADYRVVSTAVNSDVEFPATADGASFFDVRYQDFDVVLARSDVSTGQTRGQAFGTLVSFPIGGIEQTFIRSFQTVDATVDGLDFTFVNTHLEVGGAAEQAQVVQALELRGNVSQIDGPVVVVGDINSDGNTGGQSYSLLTESLTDAVPTGSAPTCCQDADIRNEASDLQTRIDVILYRGFDSVTEAEVVLDEPGDRVNSLWPSDHAGVWAELRTGGPDA